jgi:tRNA(Ile)-lysidine synthase
MLFPFEQKIKLYIQQQALMPQSAPILVAVSGGPDSLCLLHILYKLGYKVVAAHINYQLRGKASNADEKFVRGFCAKYGIPLCINRFDTSYIAKSGKQGIQETARSLRYEWFKTICLESGYFYVATAHHSDDQAETVLFNLMRGTGIKGTAGIHPKRILHKGSKPSEDILLIRPMLGVTKQEILSYLEKQNIKYRLDKSNLHDDYTRNKIRHQILPRINEIQSQATKHLADFADHIQDILPGYEAWLAALNKKYIQPQKDFIQFKLDRKLNPGLIYLLLEPYGFNSFQAHQIHDAIVNKKTGISFITKEYKLLVGHQYADLVLIKDIGSIHVDISDLPSQHHIMETRIVIRQTESTLSHSDTEVLLDRNKINFPLVLRTWQAGDRMAPLGMKGKQKKIQDILTDKKVSGVRKKNALVLVSGEKIIWLWPCMVISEHVKLDAASDKIIIIKSDI